jgi:hypothetical protein
MKPPVALILTLPVLAIAAQQDSPSTRSNEQKAKAGVPVMQKMEGRPFATSAVQSGKNGGKAYSDSEYAWDEFKHRGRTVWACRGVHTGDFVSESLCAFQPKTDSHWPGKDVPAKWDGTTHH